MIYAVIRVFGNRSTQTSIFMGKTHQLCLPILTAFILSLATPIQAQDTTYVWKSTDGDPLGLAGTIVLDSPSSANGTKSDFVSVTLSDQISGTYHVSLGTDLGFSLTTFAWNPEQITSMGWGWQNFLGQIWQISATTPGTPPGTYILDAGKGAEDESGAWLVQPAVVPEPSALTLLSSSLMLGWFARRYHRSR